ncbi:antitoxin [Gordonia sp. Z-3]|jgi:plasmid stability protein|uniref:Antitoxin n=2 Tax=Gordonia TaxID=2053 RepID=A0A9X3I403_9ACTN|nr:MULTISPECIES: antitoxin [Gordonia]MAU80428.1 plasmid stability protein [Gordonia sp. (in: high G+C Gram-positive bacteria)]MCF3941505.1 antitoxin [Gordonia tangerina]MCX2964213.1 antitoxin [Gordonia aquimaris]MED5801821.1 antitoxin [Gordonia sp. Z-3]
MAAITVRGLSDETHRALKARAAQHNRSTEAEVRAILDEAVSPADQVKLGTLLTQIGKKAGIGIEIERDRTPDEPVDFS